jgi:UDP-2,3-diacylglucosamine pyrophosphatase LpxH
MDRARRIFIISDLHLGGRPPDNGQLGFQMCRAYAELAEFVDWVRTQPLAANEERELVVNGDVVDFLAEDDFDGGVVATEWTVDDAAAVVKLAKIVDRARGFFDALAHMLRDGHRVTFVLGNHDVELSLPRVRARLEDVLGPGRLRFVYDGEAYAVGRVLIEHGNRYDRWNLLNFDRLREERSVRSRGLPIDDRRDRFFRAPAGTLLVMSFMNPLKRRYRFIDLLKPETGAVLPLLLALEPDLEVGLRALLRAAPIVRGIARFVHDKDGMPLDPGELGGPEPSDSLPLTLDEVLREELGANAALFIEHPDDAAGELGGVREIFAALRDMAKRLREAAAGLGNLAAIKLASDDDTRRKRLRAALAHTAAIDRSFNPAYEVESYRRAAVTLCKRGGFDLVVMGHTHLPKHVDLSNDVGRAATYLNTGTWASVIRLDELPQPIDDKFIEAVQTNQLDAYTRRYLTYAEVHLDGDAVREATIRSFCGKRRPREEPLVAAP